MYQKRPFHLPGFVLNSWTVKLFNKFYYWRQRDGRKIVDFDSFFYPLDSIHHWNRIYGARGFYQYQCVLPHTASHDSTRELLGVIAASRQASFLAVLKTFGELRSPGLLSFPRPGVTLALDFGNHGQRTLDLFNRLDAIVEQAGGSVYPAKDARMSGERFRSFFPQ